MSSNLKKYLSVIYPIILGISFVSTTTFAAKPILDKNFTEYYLKGTLENTSSFNFNLTPGEEITDYITILNNTDNEIKYLLQGVDSKINNQQVIVFKSTTDDNLNLGQWLSFKETAVTVPSKGSLTIPFSIKPAANAYPGSYYGGISIVKKKSPETISTTEKNIIVQTLTRQVIGLTVNIEGSVNKDYQIENFIYNKEKNRYQFTITNTGDTILSFKGKLSISNNNLNSTIEDEIKIEKFRILPKNSITKTLPYSSQPLFGSHRATLDGELKSFNGILNADEPFENILLTLETTFSSWIIIGIASGVIVLLILLIVLTIIKDKNYLKSCVKYTVKKDDTLLSIAQNYNMSWKKLASINKLKAPYALKPDQKILVHESPKV